MSQTIAPQPHSTEAERTTLGALLLDPDAIGKVAGELAPEDFFDPVNATIYKAIKGLHEERTPVDFVTVAKLVETDKKCQAAGGSAFLAELADKVPTSSHVEAYARIVRQQSLKRRTAQLARSIEQKALDPDEPAETVIDAAEQGVLQISRDAMAGVTYDLTALADERYNYYTAVYEAEDKAAFYGLTTGFPDLDRLLTGLPPSDLIVIAARPSMGKTAFVLDIARHVTRRLKKKVMLVSLEMSKEQVADRLFAGALGVSTQDLSKGQIEEQTFRRMGAAFGDIPANHLFVNDDCNSTLADLRSKARRQQMEHGLDLLIVDYLQLLNAGGRVSPENRVQEISKISRDLKRLARELRVPVIAVSQLSRNVENRPSKLPQLSDLRESGSIEQDADTVLMLYRDDYYDEDTDRPGITDVFVRKQRQGPTGRIEVRFNREQMRHESIAREGIDATQEG